MIFLSSSQEKNLYGLGFDEDDDDLTEMNPEEMVLAYAVPGEMNAIAVSSAGDLWGGYARSNVVVAEARDMEAKDRGGRGQGQEEQANLWTDKPPPTLQPADCCPSHGKPYM